ncbi:hypothetical protein ACFLUH_03915, partial [Chloroflexota bacterium]
DKPLNESQIIAQDIAALTAGQSLRYKLGEKYGSGKDVAIIELNPEHGKKMGMEGRKYMVTIGEETTSYPMGYNNNANQIASFVRGRKGVKAT